MYRLVVLLMFAVVLMVACSTKTQEPVPAPVPTPLPPVPLPIPPPSVRDIQHALNAKGYHLKEDGKIGPITMKALVYFQKDVGIVPTNGQVDDATLRALGLER